MTTRQDTEWEGWTRAWRAEGAPAPEVRSRLEANVRRASLMMMLGAAGEAACAVGMLALAFTVAAGNPQPVILARAAAVWLFVFAAWGFSMWNRRGIWQPAGRTTEAFVALARERCLRKLRTVRFTRWLLAAEVLFLIPWGWWEYASDPLKFAQHLEAYLFRYGLVAFLVLVASVWSVRYGRRARRELAALEESQREA
jgi:hypothetical protein